jgi:DNA-binding CsgD family transcriptional regulator
VGRGEGWWTNNELWANWRRVGIAILVTRVARGSDVMARSGTDRSSEREPGRPALETALDAIGCPALIVGAGGEILRANGAAQALLERDALEIRTSLVKALGGQHGRQIWVLTPLRDTDLGLGFLALLRISSESGKLADAVREASRLWKLTERQRQVLALVANGQTNALVAEELAVAEHTVEFHVSAIFDKSGVDNRASLIAKLLEL